jgi:protein phosphatase 1 regulatory subunit 7
LKDKEKLETVYFEGNPLQLNGPAVYRNKVRLALPNIQQIDASKSFYVSQCGCDLWFWKLMLTTFLIAAFVRV